MVVPASGAASNAAPTIGVLALQGDFDLHVRTLAALGIVPRGVRTSRDLDGLRGLILPGGESSAMLRLMEGTTLEHDIRAFHAGGGAVFGTCAGMILLATKVTHPEQRSLELLDADVERNGYGRQVDSFETDLEWTEDQGTIRGVFIRAPRFTRLGPKVRVLASRDGEPVLVREGRILAAAFHPELTDDTRVHQYFVESVMADAATAE